MSKNVYFDVLDDIVDKYNNTYHKTIKMKPTDVKSDSYTEYIVDSNEKDPKFIIDNQVRISKYKNIFAKGYAPNWSEEGSIISKIKNKVHGNMSLVILTVKKLLEHFLKKNCRDKTRSI